MFLKGLNHSSLDLWMSRHAQIVIAAPDVDVTLTPTKLSSSGKSLSRAVYTLEHPVRVVELLLQQLLLEEDLVWE